MKKLTNTVVKFPFRVGDIIITNFQYLASYVGRRARVTKIVNCNATQDTCWGTCRYGHVKMDLAFEDGYRQERLNLCAGIKKLYWKVV